MKTSRKAFSMIELIFAIVILGTIAAVAIPKLSNSKNSANVAVIKQDISTVVTSLQSYYLLNDKLDKISDVVNLNSKIWDISDNRVSVSFDSKECVSIEISGSSIVLSIDHESTSMCQKLYDDGIKNNTYNLM
jgi:general secretion pathway protein G